jgi:hypothetical protein
MVKTSRLPGLAVHARTQPAESGRPGSIERVRTKRHDPPDSVGVPVSDSATLTLGFSGGRRGFKGGSFPSSVALD